MRQSETPHLSVGQATCLSCAQGFHDECGIPCCCNRTQVQTDSPPVVALPSEGFTTAEEFYATTGYKDPHSTGRKQAAKLFEIDYDAPCEWRGLKNAGGGDNPIVGCFNGRQQSRHHGPDKNTLSNTEGNVHRICHECHNNWHSLNDSGYVWGDQIVRTPHSKETASPDELALEAIRRKTHPAKNTTRSQGD